MSADVGDLAADVVTGGPGAEAAPMVPATPAALSDDEPNGLYAGPSDDPDRFELLGRGRAGGEGVTWRCRFRGSLTTPIVYALKQLQPPDAGAAGWPTAADVRRWTDQRHLLQAVRHEHLVRVHDVFLGPPLHALGGSPVADGLEHTVPYMLMEWLEGPDLRRAVTQGDFRLATRLRHVRAVAEALASLHSATSSGGNPMLHRDVKPENCVVDATRGTVLVDLGTMRSVDDRRDPLGLHTRHYTAPEVLADPGAPRTPAADLYGLGAVAYFCIVGTDPPAADETAPPAAADLETAARAAQAADPAGVASLVVAMLAADPAQRPSRPVVWADELLACALPRPQRLRRRLLLTAATAIGTAAALLATLATPDTPGNHPVDTPGFAPFGTRFATFPATVDGDRLAITPPLGDDRYDHLWGFHSAGDACATTVEFDATIGPHDLATGFGWAVAPRSTLSDDQPAGQSVQYEWEPFGEFPVAGTFARPAELPGGAWRGADDPEPMPDVGTAHHVTVQAVGTEMSLDVDGHAVSYEIPETECGGVTVRAWGAPVEFANIRVFQT